MGFSDRVMCVGKFSSPPGNWPPLRVTALPLHCMFVVASFHVDCSSVFFTLLACARPRRVFIGDHSIALILSTASAPTLHMVAAAALAGGRVGDGARRPDSAAQHPKTTREVSPRRAIRPATLWSHPVAKIEPAPGSPHATLYRQHHIISVCLLCGNPYWGAWRALQQHSAAALPMR